MSGSLGGRVALVTGAGRGPGRAIALALAGAGASVGLIDVNPDGLQRTADEIARLGGQASAHATDVGNKVAVQTAIYQVLEKWGRVDLLVNAAHVAPRRPALTLGEWEWNRALEVNLKGAFLAAQTAARAMKESGGGIILNVVRPAEAGAHAAVRASRAGLIGLTEALAAEWAEHGVRVERLDCGADAATIGAEAVSRCERM